MLAPALQTAIQSNSKLIRFQLSLLNRFESIIPGCVSDMPGDWVHPWVGVGFGPVFWQFYGLHWVHWYVLYVESTAFINISHHKTTVFGQYWQNYYVLIPVNTSIWKCSDSVMLLFTVRLHVIQRTVLLLQFCLSVCHTRE